MEQASKMCSLWIDDHSVETKNVTIGELKEFKGHPFKVINDNSLYELMKSIEDNGVLVPLIVRPSQDGSGYEIISGHRRKVASEWVGLSTIPVTVMNLTDAEAVIAMVDSNLQREKIRPSEKAFAYKMKRDAMKQQGKKIDITLSQVETKITKELSDSGKPVLRTDEILARQVGESRNQIARYIRLTNLIPKILDMVDEEQIAFTIAVELSYLKEEEQYELHAVMDLEQCTPSLSQANRLKRMSQSGQLDMDMMYEILGEEKANQREQIKIRADTLEQYFPLDYTPKQKVELIEKLVKEWHEEQQISKEVPRRIGRGR
jgi:ParB family transcriptional regulator, chromosome partitioning protein